MSLLGIFANRPVSFSAHLRPASLASLTASRDAWGTAVFGRGGEWHRQDHVGSAAEHSFLASTSTDASTLLAQAYMRTVGDARVVRNPPFRRGRWVFVHSGTIDDPAFVRGRTSNERRRQCGESPSELLFAFLLTRLDDHDLTERHAPEEIDRVMTQASADLASGLIGSSTFLLSDGESLYAHRAGRALHMLDKRDGPLSSVLLLASEPITADAWTPLDDGALVRCRRSTSLDVSVLASPPRESLSLVELPFTD